MKSNYNVVLLILIKYILYVIVLQLFKMFILVCLDVPYQACLDVPYQACLDVGAAPPLNYRLALWTDLAVGANGPPIH